MLSSSVIFLSVLSLLLLLSLSKPINGAVIIKKGSKDWSAVNWDKLEADWEEGDEPEELRSDDDDLKDEMDRRKLEAETMTGENDDMDVGKTLNQEQMNKLMARSKSGLNKKDTGPAMMFVSLKPEASPSYIQGKDYSKKEEDETKKKKKKTKSQQQVKEYGAWEKKDVEALSSSYKELLQSAGFEVTLFEMGPDELLCSAKKGWYGDEIVDFFVTRKEVKSVEYNSRTIQGGYDKEL